MPGTRQQQLQDILLGLLPSDHTAVGNGALLALFQEAAKAQGVKAGEGDFQAAREALVASGQAIKGKGRGGSTARATGAQRPEFDLQAEQVAPDAEKATASTATRKVKAPTTAQGAGDPQVLSYRHADRRKNNPEVGLVNEASDPEQPKTAWAYDPHLDPVLQFDSARAGAEKLIEDALAGDDPVAMRHVLETLRRMSAPYLQWTGKAERTSFEVDTVSLHVHERIDAMSILSAVSKRQAKKGDKAATGGIQPGLFEAPFESMPLRSAVDFYKHDRGWANRLVAGDSLLVMNSLLQKEGMAGQVQMIYIDPPYGIKYGSNFQPFTNKRDVKDRSDADLTQEPEMIKAFRDTWELGIHSYLTYLRDRLLLAKDLLSETGSVFVQISDENLHHVRELCDEVFGSANFVSVISFQTTSGFAESNGLSRMGDYLVWYGVDRTKTKVRALFEPQEIEPGGANASWLLFESGRYRGVTSKEEAGTIQLPSGSRLYNPDNLLSQNAANEPQPFEYCGSRYEPSGNNHWKPNFPVGLERLARSGRLHIATNSIRFRRFAEDFPVKARGNLWTDTLTGSFTESKQYVVQTNAKVLERCLLLTTDPGDLVFDPTCGSGTTAYVAEKWGRRWITCDTSRVAVTLAKQRLMTASFDYFALRYPHEGLKGGFIYKTVPHVTLKSIANNPEIDVIYERLHPGIDAALADLNAGLATEPPANAFPVTEGARKGQKLALGKKGVALLEWEVPFDFPAEWPAQAQPLFAAFHTARQKMQAEMDRSIASNADNETLYDQPEKTKTSCACPARSR
jgi:adenine-specific DNA-methyltransferase